MSPCYHFCATQPSGRPLCMVAPSASRKCFFPTQHFQSGQIPQSRAVTAWSHGHRSIVPLVTPIPLVLALMAEQHLH